MALIVDPSAGGLTTFTDGSIPYASGGVLVQDNTNFKWNPTFKWLEANVKFLQSGTGALTRTVSAKLRDSVSTADFDTAGNYATARNALTATVGFNKVDISGASGTNLAITGATTSQLVTINGGSTTNTDAKLGIKISTANETALSIANGAVDPWFHVNANGIGFIGNGTTIPFHSIESDTTLKRELRCDITADSADPGGYGRVWAKATTPGSAPMDLLLTANNNVHISAGTANDGSDRTKQIFFRATTGFVWSNQSQSSTYMTLDKGGSGSSSRLFLQDAATPSVIMDSTGITVKTGAAYSVNAVQVVGARDTGWTAMTGTPDKATAYATGTVTLAQLAGRVAQLQASLTTHGLIGT